MAGFGLLLRFLSTCPWCGRDFFLGVAVFFLLGVAGFFLTRCGGFFLWRIFLAGVVVAGRSPPLGLHDGFQQESHAVSTLARLEKNYTSEDPKQNASNHTGSRWNALEPNLASPADAAKNV